MPSFLAETFHPALRLPELRESEDRVRAAAKALTRAGTPVRYVRSIFVPEDEICFFVLEAPSEAAARAAASKARLRIERVVEAVESEKEER